MRLPLKELLLGEAHSDVARLLQKREAELEDARIRIRQLESALDARAAETAALRRIGEAMGHVISTEEMLRLVADVGRQVTGTESSLIYLFNDTRDELILRAVTDEDLGDVVGKIRVKIGEGITGIVARDKEHIAIAAEAWHDERFRFFPGLHEDRFQSLLCVPLIWRSEVIGVINVRTRAPRDYTKTQVQLLAAIASQVAGAIETSRMASSVEKRTSHLSTVAEVSRTITSNLYLDEILQLAVAATAQTMNFKIVALLLLDPDKNELVLKATQSNSRDYVKKPNLPLGESIAGRALTEGRTITVLDVKRTSEYRYPEIAKREGLTSLACVPLTVRERVIGVLNCYTEKLHVFTEDEIAVLTTLGNQVAVAIENSKLMVKGALLQEMHHRVKNNLQTIASLLRLQTRYAADRSPVEVLNESISRVMAVAAVHDLLAREDLDTISVRKIANSIVTTTQQSFTLPGKHITMRVEGPELLLGSNKANSVALILNELVQNAAEHGFEHASAGSILVRIREDGERCRLEVRNDGDPLPPGFDPRKSSSLGLQIVESLARGDLNGDFTLASEGSETVAVVAFPR